MKDKEVLTFGKYKGKTPEEVARIDPEYLAWAYNNITPKPCSRALYEDYEQDSYEDGKMDDMIFGLDGW